jgi:hypothetical protein
MIDMRVARACSRGLYYNLAFFLVTSCIAYADIKNCNGVITNQECEGGGSKVMEEQPYKTPLPEAAEVKQKETLLERLRSAIGKAKSEQGVAVDIRVTETVCKMSSVTECKDLVIAKERELNALVESARISLERRKEREALLKETSLAPNENEPAAVKSQMITVVQNQVTSNIAIGVTPASTPITGYKPVEVKPVSPVITAVTGGITLPKNTSQAPLITGCAKDKGACSIK